MALRAGMYRRAVFQGVLRDDSYPVYACIHSHRTSEAAVACARECLKYLKSATGTPPLPSGWIHYAPEMDS